MSRETLEALIGFCRRLPHATEDLKWDQDLVFSIGGKMFAVFDQREGNWLSFKTTPAGFTELTGRPGVAPAPKAARFHWVRLESADMLPEEETHTLLRESYHLVALSLPAKIRRQLSEQQ